MLSAVNRLINTCNHKFIEILAAVTGLQASLSGVTTYTSYLPSQPTSPSPRTPKSALREEGKHEREGEKISLLYSCIL